MLRSHLVALVVVALALTADVSAPQNQIARVTPEPTPSAPIKQPALSFALSLVTFGMASGQNYNGQSSKAHVMRVVSGSGWLLMIVGTVSKLGCYGKGGSSGPQSCFSNLTDVINVGVGLSSAGWAWSVIDAPISSVVINGRNARRVSLDIEPRVTELSRSSTPIGGLGVVRARLAQPPRVGLSLATVRF